MANTAVIPEVVCNLRCYYDNRPTPFTGDLTLPVLARTTQEISGAGIAGPVAVPVIGSIASMQAQFATRVASPEFFATFAHGRHTLEFRGVIQGSAATEAVQMNFSCFMSVACVSVTPGTLTRAGEMGATASFEVFDELIQIDGTVYVDISKLNDICRIRNADGELVDELANSRKFLQ
jgi:phage tail tube protein FII